MALGCGGFKSLLPVFFAILLFGAVWGYRHATARGMVLPVGQIIVILIGNLIGLGVYLVVRQNVYLVRYPHCDHKRLKRRAVSPRCGDT